jgi:hypothetical protein
MAEIAGYNFPAPEILLVFKAELSLASPGSRLAHCRFYETVEKPAHVTREIFGADIGGGTKEHPLKGL